LLEADVSKPLNGTGSMRAAFTTISAGWSLIERNPKMVAQHRLNRSKLARLLASPYGDRNFKNGEKRGRAAQGLLEEMKVDVFCGEGSMRRALFDKVSDSGQAREEELFDQREGERLVLLDWITKAEYGDKQEFIAAFDNDRYDLQGRLADIPITQD